ncbi:unnamed protein product [Eruca vesicaria subsp. sativa]|uniref:Uncharacterized protein n=1 Tax=Eruca vesicaria subsp. sativa TaxID=29727 RepID=A0ABC8IZT5_ERUVS|nr:unnamed protein product [Eruca vesicaria subsp. sativa]
MQDYHELRKEREFKMRKLEMIKQRRSTLDPKGRFLRRRYKQFKQDQTLDTSTPGVLRLSESGDLKVPSKRKKNSEKEALALDKKNPKRSRGNEEQIACDF